MQLPKPITRTDYYLAKIAGDYTGNTPTPISRKDFYLSNIAGDYTGHLPNPITRTDFYLSKIAGNYTGDTPKPITRKDYMLSAIAGDYSGELPEPITREEMYLTAIANQDKYVIKDTQGTEIYLNDSVYAPLEGLKLFGKSTQDGTPSPENPVSIVNVGESGSITVSVGGQDADTQTLILSTPNGLHGIPVSSGGNYTDENGQQWVCDEVDFARGVYVKRVAKQEFTSLELKSKDARDRFVVFNFFKIMSKNGNYKSMCNMGVWNSYALYHSDNWVFSVSINALYALPPNGHTYDTVESVNEYFSEVISEDSPIVFLSMLEDEEEIPLTQSELSAYSALHTNYPTTTVTNDAGAWMEVGYKARPTSLL